MKYQRGQTLVETGFMLPLVLLVLFGVIYFTRFGVVSERSQLAVRYGGLYSYSWVAAPNCSTGSCYSGNNIYDFYTYALGNGSDPLSCPTPATAAYSMTSPFPNPAGETGVYFQPDSVGSTTCSNETSTLAGTGGAGGFNYPHTIQAIILSSATTVNIPSWLSNIVGLNSALTTTLPFAHPSYPALTLCNPAPDSMPTGAYQDVWYALKASVTAAPPQQPACPAF